MLPDTVVKIIHPDSLGQAKGRNKQQQERLKQYANFLQTEDEEDIEAQLLDLRKMNKIPQEYIEWFEVANSYLDDISSVDS